MSFNLSAVAVRERAVTLFFILLMTAAGAYAFLMLEHVSAEPNRKVPGRIKGFPRSCL